MPRMWNCCICDNIFYFNNNDQRLGFMLDHSTSCCKVTYPNGITAYVGPSTKSVNRSIYKMITNIDNNNKVNYIESTYDNNTDTKEDNKPWITVPDMIGYATAKILVVLRDMYNIPLEQDLESLKYVEEQAFITELDREKAVKIYCTTNLLVDKIKRIVNIDQLLYSILVDDDKIMRSMSYNETDKRNYYINTNSRNMYARQIACALRRLDRLTNNINISF